MNAESLTVTVDEATKVSARIYRSPSPGPSLILGHGAGAPQTSPFMVEFATAMAARGVSAITFNFRYTEQKRKVPDPPAALENCYRAVVRAVDDARLAAGGLFIGGKSMGGRIATQVAAADASLTLAGLVLLGYPLHPPGRPQQTRDAHLPRLGRRALFVQGSRDTFGTPAELAPVLARMTPTPELHVVEGGDHSFKVTRVVDRQRAVIDQVQTVAANWMLTVAGA